MLPILTELDAGAIAPYPKAVALDEVLEATFVLAPSSEFSDPFKAFDPAFEPKNTL